MNATNGAHIWNVSFGGVIDGASPVVSRGLVISGSDRQNASDPTAGKVMAINASTGSIVYTFMPPPGGVYSSPAASATTVYLAAPEANASPHTGPAALFALSLEDGRVLWNFSTPSMGAKGAGGAVRLSPDGRLAVFGAGDNNVYAVNAATGQSAATSLRRPYRAWAFAYNLTNTTLLDEYKGTNLIPTWSSKYGGAEVVENIEQQGVSVLKW